MVNNDASLGSVTLASDLEVLVGHLQVADAEAYAALVRANDDDKAMMAYLPEVLAENASLERVRAKFKLHEGADGLLFGVWLRERGAIALVGSLELGSENDPTIYFIDGWLATRSRQRKIAPSALRLVARYMFRIRGASALVARIDPTNRPSQATVANLGFTLVTCAKELLEYELTREQYNKGND
jgi:RimJ/RimL family protein N-acetyltransferase